MIDCSKLLTIAKPQDQDVLHHLLPKVVVYPEDLFLSPIRLQSFLQFPRGAKIFSERLLDLYDRIRVDKQQQGGQHTMMRANPFLG